jgi:pimeloyl-ACP methyl ester carboxylesterase
MPIQIKLIIYLCKLIGIFSPTLSASIAYHIWTKATRHDFPSRELKWKSLARTIDIDFNGSSVSVYEWGDGATVLLVHGWSGRGTQLGAIGLALANDGYKAVAIDLPGHGHTPGSHTNAFEMSRAIKSVAQYYGDVHGIVTHSFGVFPAAILLREELSVNRMVCVSPPDNIKFLLDLFCRWLKLSDKVIEKLNLKLEQLFGSDVWQKISPDFNLSNSTIPGLIIHDSDDQQVPWTRGQALANHWPNAAFHLSSGLGHRRILRHKDVIEKIVIQMNLI